MDLDPKWVVGFVDGEGCFYIGVNRHPEMATGYQVLPEFRVVQHQRDIQILYGLKRFFRFGVVRRNHGDRYEFRVRKLKSLVKLCEFFTKNPLKTKKAIEFKRFQRVINLMKEGKHLTLSGLLRIVTIAEKMNRSNSHLLGQIRKELKAKLDKDIVHT